MMVDYLTVGLHIPVGPLSYIGQCTLREVVFIWKLTLLHPLVTLAMLDRKHSLVSRNI